MAKAGICDMCGHHIGIRHKAHIVSEGRKTGPNLLMLCPSCHAVFDSQLKPKIYQALVQAGVKGLPETWRTSAYEQAARASAAARRRRKA